MTVLPGDPAVYAPNELSHIAITGYSNRIRQIGPDAGTQ